MRIYYVAAIISSLAIIAFSCSSSKKSLSGDINSVVSMQASGNTVSALPPAVAYKTNGNYNDNVFITLSADGKSVVYYPDPRDVSANSAPLNLGDGWLLDRRGGINDRAAFIKYTYAQYANLPSAPSISELLEAIIPTAKVTEVQRLPISYSEALDNPQAAAALLY